MLLELMRGGLETTCFSLRPESQVSDDYLHLDELSNRYGRDDDSVEVFMIKVARASLLEARHSILNDTDGDNRLAFGSLQKLNNSVQKVGPHRRSQEIIFATHVLRGLGCCG